MIANNVTKWSYITDARKVLKKSKEVTNQQPVTITSDGLKSYIKAIKKEFKIKKDRFDRPLENSIQHIRVKTIRDHTHNNLIERYHNNFKGFDKVRRGFKAQDTAQEWTEGYALFHNFIKKGIDNLTPSERAKINLMLCSNRWVDLLKQSVKATNLTKTQDDNKSLTD